MASGFSIHLKGPLSTSHNPSVRCVVPTECTIRTVTTERQKINRTFTYPGGLPLKWSIEWAAATQLRLPPVLVYIQPHRSIGEYLQCWLMIICKAAAPYWVSIDCSQNRWWTGSALDFLYQINLSAAGGWWIGLKPPTDRFHNNYCMTWLDHLVTHNQIKQTDKV